MIRDILRTIGTACILAGGILYFTTNSENSSTEEMQQIQNEVKKLQSELAIAKEELAIAQTISSVEASDSTSESSFEIFDNYVLRVERGSNSKIVSTTLERIGVIQNASEFDVYLATNGLSRKIQVGEYELDPSMDYGTIAKIITTVK